MAGGSGLEPVLSTETPGFSLVPQFPAGELYLPTASISILQSSSFPLGVTAAQGTQQGPSTTPAVPGLPLLSGCCCLAGTTTPGHALHSNELLWDAETHFQDPSHLHGWFLLLSPARLHRLLPKSPTFCLINHPFIIAR